MAELKKPVLRFFDHQAVNPGGDPGQRVIELPAPLPSIGDDFDWDIRDYEGFRDFMLAELRTRFPERQRWTPADMEVVLIEALAAVLDHLSDMADRVAAESSLLTARRAESLERWLGMIGMEPARERFAATADPKERSRLLHHFYQANPHEMERDRRRGPGTIRTQERMVSLSDYELGLCKHPLVSRARARKLWQGAWPVVRITVMLWKNIGLDDPPQELPALLTESVYDFHKQQDLYLDTRWVERCTVRDVLSSYIEAYRAVGQTVYLDDVAHVGLALSLDIRILPAYFQSEVRYEIMRALGRGPGGFFEPGRFTFGQDVRASDIFECLMSLEGVEHVRLLKFCRVDQASRHTVLPAVQLNEHEVAVCDNDGRFAARGVIELQTTGGRTG